MTPWLDGDGDPRRCYLGHAIEQQPGLRIVAGAEGHHPWGTCDCGVAWTVIDIDGSTLVVEVDPDGES